MDFASKLINKFPKSKEVVPVIAVVAFPIYAWTVGIWLWKFPSWLLFLTPLEIAAVFCYAIVVALVDSVLAFSLIFLVTLILPARLFRDAFHVRGTWMAIGLNLCFIGNGGRQLIGTVAGFNPADISLPTWLIIGIFVVVVLTFFSIYFRSMRSFAVWFSERLVVFLYLQVPVSILSMIVVTARNIF